MDLQHTASHAVTCGKNQGHKACVNRLVSEFALFFCQLAHPLPHSDAATLIFQGRACLGERVR